MKYNIDIQEIVTRVNTYTIEVEDKGEGIMIENLIQIETENAHHPDDIHAALKAAGCKIEKCVEGSEEIEYEVL